LAISRKRKEDLVAQYSEWMNRSQAMVVTQYTGLTMKDVDTLRSRIRNVGGEFHILKNTLGNVAFKEAGLNVPQNLMEGSTAVIFAFGDAAETVKVVTEYAAKSEFVKIKGGLFDKRPISIEDVKALADLPPLPVMRAQLLGVLSAPASKLVRTLAEPGRGLAAALQAYVDKQSAAAEAPALAAAEPA
jgi:large subunit ribosomal protein L10